MDSLQFASGNLIIDIIILALGIAILIKGSGWFVDSACHIARQFNIPEIVIGLTLVSIGTSLPELGTNIYASLSNEGGIVLGNVVGSNITNMTLILGAGILFSSGIAIPKEVLKRDAVLMVFIFIIFTCLCYLEHSLNRFDGIVMLIIFAGYVYYLFKSQDSLDEEIPSKQKEKKGSTKASVINWLLLALGLVMVFIGAKMMVDPIVTTALKFKINEALVAATVIAFGTSVPELAITISGIHKKKNSIALGNVIGSCTFNIILVMGASAVINPVPVGTQMLHVVLPLMICAGFLLMLFMRTNWKLTKNEGITFLVLYLLFIVYNIIMIKS